MFLFFHFLFLLLCLSVELGFCLHSSTTTSCTTRCQCDPPHRCTDSMLAPSMGMTQSYPTASPRAEGRVTKCPSCINNNVSSSEDTFGGQNLCVEVTSGEEKEVDCSVAKTSEDSDIQDGDCDIMLQSCEEVLTEEPGDAACLCPKGTRITHTGSLPKKWKDSLNSRTKAWGRRVSPPFRMTSDGTVVNYWCDLPRKSVTGNHGMFFCGFLTLHGFHWLFVLYLDMLISALLIVFSNKQNMVRICKHGE